VLAAGQGGGRHLPDERGFGGRGGQALQGAATRPGRPDDLRPDADRASAAAGHVDAGEITVSRSTGKTRSKQGLAIESTAVLTASLTRLRFSVELLRSIVPATDPPLPPPWAGEPLAHRWLARSPV